MSAELLELNYEITAYVYELHELQQIIRDLATNPQEPIYMAEVSERYIKLCDKLRIVLEAYFKEESLVGVPTEFSYRKLYKQLIT